jgi:zinc transport system substrate-binding protein
VVKHPGWLGASLILLGALLFSACSASTTSAASVAAPVLSVVTGLYPIQQAVQQIGQSKVDVTDVVPPGDNPLTYALTPAAISEVRSATLIVDVGGGFQPSFERAAGSGNQVLSLGAAIKTSNPYFWLDPNVMEVAISRMAAAMEKADPKAAGVFRQGAEDFAAEVNSTGIDYENTLSTCPRQTIFTANEAFSDVARDYGLQNVLIGTGSNPPPSIATSVESSGATTIFSEPWVSDDAVDMVAAQSHVKVRQLDTLAGPPPGGWPTQATYINLLESNLGTLSNALGCPNTSTGT